MVTYRLQEGRFGENWTDVDDYPRDASDLAAWVQIARNCETFDGKYELRIIDDASVEVWHLVEPYEGASINLFDPPAQWLEAIRQDYGIEADLFLRACRAWIGEHS